MLGQYIYTIPSIPVTLNAALRACQAAVYDEIVLSVGCTAVLNRTITVLEFCLLCHFPLCLLLLLGAGIKGLHDMQRRQHQHSIRVSISAAVSADVSSRRGRYWKQWTAKKRQAGTKTQSTHWHWRGDTNEHSVLL